MLVGREVFSNHPSHYTPAVNYAQTVMIEDEEDSDDE
jgi:hypothetical protein